MNTNPTNNPKLTAEEVREQVLQNFFCEGNESDALALIGQYADQECAQFRAEVEALKTCIAKKDEAIGRLLHSDRDEDRDFAREMLKLTPTNVADKITELKAELAAFRNADVLTWDDTCDDGEGHCLIPALLEGDTCYIVRAASKGGAA